MKFDHAVKYNGVIFAAGTELPEPEKKVDEPKKETGKNDKK